MFWKNIAMKKWKQIQSKGSWGSLRKKLARKKQKGFLFKIYELKISLM
jgi:hypothetical protein